MNTHHEEHERWMGRAIDLARRGEGLTRPNPPVGAVLVKDGRVLAEGYHRQAGSAHAEIVALRRAGRQAKGSTLYVTLEPCCTWGRTGPCTESILSHGVTRVIVAVRDPNPRHRGRGLALLRRRGIKVIEGICRGDAARMLTPFSKWISTGRPYLTLKLAMTLDGRIADSSGRSKWLTGAKSRALVHSMRRRVDVVMVGARTVLNDDPSLLPRPARGRCPVRVIVDRNGLTPPSCRILRGRSGGQVVVATTRACPAKRRKQYEAMGAEVLVLPARRGGMDLGRLFERLGRRGLLHVLCEGGGELAESLVRLGLVDELLFFVAPGFLGGNAVPALAGQGWPISAMPKVKILSCERIGPDVLVRALPFTR